VNLERLYTFKLAMGNGIELKDLLFDDPDPHSGDPVNSLREIGIFLLTL